MVGVVYSAPASTAASVDDHLPPPGKKRGLRTPARAASSKEDGATDEQTAEVMATLWERYKGTMTARMSVIEGATRRLLDGELSDKERTNAHAEAHKLAGSIGTFGYLEASRLAREIEELLERQGPLGEAEAAQLSALAARLRAEVDQAAAHSPRDVP